MTTIGDQARELAGLGWPTIDADVSRETSADVSRETEGDTSNPADERTGLGWPT